MCKVNHLSEFSVARKTLCIANNPYRIGQKVPIWGGVWLKPWKPIKYRCEDTEIFSLFNRLPILAHSDLECSFMKFAPKFLEPLLSLTIL